LSSADADADTYANEDADPYANSRVYKDANTGIYQDTNATADRYADARAGLPGAHAYSRVRG
jgi:hypothetical protein